MPDLLDIYAHQADKYDLLVSREDYHGNLLPAIQSIVDLDGKNVVELGAGTGRVTGLLVPYVNSIRAFDASEAMLEVARRRLAEKGFSNCSFAVGDHRRIEAPDACTDIVISGWSLCCLVAYAKGDWRPDIDAALAEAERVLAPGGKIVVIETLGTGFKEPNPPAKLSDYYSYLEAKGFTKSWIRTDYRFESLPEAEDLTEFFFGRSPIAALEEQAGSWILPECTGIWAR